MKNIYLDYNSHTPCDTLVVEAMDELWTQPGNPHSVNHAFGWSKEQVIKDALESFSEIYDCFEDELIFTSGATEANNLAITAGIKIAKGLKPNANTILTSYLEHKSVLAPLELISKKLNLNLIYIDLNDNGKINLENLEHHLDRNDVLWVSCAMTNGVIGTNQPISAISEICNQNNVFLHVDASQASYLPISCLNLDVDFLTLSAHKIYGPSGIGLLYSKHLQNPDFEPMIVGGGQQDGLRAGTLATPLIVGFQKAAEIMCENKEVEAESLKQLRQILLENLSKKLDIEVIGDAKSRHPGNLYLAISGVDSVQLLNNLQPHLAFSLSSACDGLNREYPPLLKAIGINKEKAETTLRICVGRMTTEAEVTQAANMIVSTAHKVNKMT
ncbi:cysteine desulfurase family protein [Psychrobacter sp. AOP7-D1-15]|uniref:cysteine desulfurase family protein n=1 Tax=unclassified Psychrobacter TaxID=196806 RepID=UPI0018665D45|nr:cysteine desulfurase family protein [Psychrobacter sp. FME61]